MSLVNLSQPPSQPESPCGGEVDCHWRVRELTVAKLSVFWRFAEAAPRFRLISESRPLVGYHGVG
jgi:hypothetical protein